MQNSRLAGTSLALLWAVSPVSAQQSDSLQQQLQQLKQQYADTTRDLEQRIAGLEQQIAEQRVSDEKNKLDTISAAELVLLC